MNTSLNRSNTHFIDPEHFKGRYIRILVQFLKEIFRETNRPLTHRYGQLFYNKNPAFLFIFSTVFRNISLWGNAPDHHHQILPTGGKSVGLSPIKVWEGEGAGLQLHVGIDHGGCQAEHTLQRESKQAAKCLQIGTTVQFERVVSRFKTRGSPNVYVSIPQERKRPSVLARARITTPLA